MPLNASTAPVDNPCRARKAVQVQWTSGSFRSGGNEVRPGVANVVGPG
jgi:hypothetical protein